MNRRKKLKQDSSELFLPPDEDNYERHGHSNMVLKFNETNPRLELDNFIHRESPFFKRKMLDGVIDKMIEEINEHVEPLRDEIQSQDRLCMLFFGVGLLGTFIVGSLLMLVVSVYALIGMIIIFTMCLCGVYFRNYRRQQRLQQCIILNLSILIYLHN